MRGIAADSATAKESTRSQGRVVPARADQNRAIQLAGDKPWKWYELYRAAIRAARWREDPAATSAEDREAIRQDLQVALANASIKRFVDSAQDKPDNLLRFLEPYRDLA